jgi:ribosomal protein L21E
MTTSGIIPWVRRNIKEEEMYDSKPGLIAPEEKRHIRLSDKDMPSLKGKTVGDKVSINLEGTIAEVSKETEYNEDTERDTGNVCYRVEVDSFGGKKSKRVDTSPKKEPEEDMPAEEV